MHEGNLRTGHGADSASQTQSSELLIIDEIGYLPLGREQANLFKLPISPMTDQIQTALDKVSENGACGDE